MMNIHDEEMMLPPAMMLFLFYESVVVRTATKTRYQLLELETKRVPVVLFTALY